MKNTIEEQWIGIPNYIGLYEVSNLGKVRSLDRLVNNKKSVKSIFKKGKILKGGISVNTLVVVLSKNGYVQTFSIKALVARQFLNYKQGGKMAIKHKDGDIKNCTSTNLMITTRRDKITKCPTTNKYIGVTRSRKTYRVRVLINGVLISLGKFKTRELAKQFYDLAYDNKDKYQGNAKQFVNKLKHI